MMMSRIGRHRFARRLAAVCAGLVILATAAPAPASAHQWTEPHAWANGDTLGVNNLNVGSVVALWQRMTHAQFSNGCPASFGCTYKTDGKFGPNTRNVTLVWQATYKNLVPSMSVDGVVGPQTWNAARFFNLHREAENANFIFYCYGNCDTIYDPGMFMEYAKPFATWLADGWGCGAEIIDHPTVRDTWIYSCY